MPLPGISVSAGMRRFIQDVGARTTGTGSGSVTINKPTGVLSGDLLVCVAGAVGGAGAWTATGWTKQNDQGALPNLLIASKTAGGGEPSNYTFTNAGGGDHWGIMMAMRAAAWDAIGSIATSTATGNLVMGAITSAGGTLFGVASSCAFNDETQSTPTGMTLLTTIATGTYSPGGIMRLFRQYVNAGSTGTRTTTTGVYGGVNNAAELFGIKLA